MSAILEKITLKLWLVGLNQPLILTADQEEVSRFERNIESAEVLSGSRKFSNLSTINGKVYSINLAQLQAVEMVCDMSDFPAIKTTCTELEIALLNRDKAVSVQIGPEETFDFFWWLESDVDDRIYKSLTDIEGDRLYINLFEIIYACCSEEIYQEGCKITDQEYE